MQNKEIIILGSTGSIGVQALEIAGEKAYKVIALTANSNAELLASQIREFRPEYAALADEKSCRELKLLVADTPTKILCGKEGICEIAAMKCDYVLNSIVGMAGLEPTLCAAARGTKIALANKETLVAGGALVKKEAEKTGADILPVDSEHSAIFQSLQGCRDRSEIKRLILTASGGPFFSKKRSELQGVTLAQALNHPNWSMGAKITIDSATMMNKGLELIEAVWLFDTPPEKIDILVHRQSVIHSLVEFCDNSVIAQLGVPDMRIPIQYALTYPYRIPSPVKQLSLADYGTLTFEKPDYETFGCINICKDAISKGGILPAVANCANEQANLAFREGKIGFLDIERLVGAATAAAENKTDYNLDDLRQADKWAREFVLSNI